MGWSAPSWHWTTWSPSQLGGVVAWSQAAVPQTAVPELTDLSREPRHVHALYGTTPGQPSFANHCLLARRLVERGVKFVEAALESHSAGSAWTDCRLELQGE